MPNSILGRQIDQICRRKDLIRSLHQLQTPYLTSEGLSSLSPAISTVGDHFRSAQKEDSEGVFLLYTHRSKDVGNIWKKVLPSLQNPWSSLSHYQPCLQLHTLAKLDMQQGLQQIRPIRWRPGARQTSVGASMALLPGRGMATSNTGNSDNSISKSPGSSQLAEAPINRQAPDAQSSGAFNLLHFKMVSSKNLICSTSMTCIAVHCIMWMLLKPWQDQILSVAWDFRSACLHLMQNDTHSNVDCARVVSMAQRGCRGVERCSAHQGRMKLMSGSVWCPIRPG